MRRLAVYLTLAFGLVGTTYALARSGSDEIHACAAKVGGALRIADRCGRNERAIAWSKAGPVGPAGPSDAFYWTGAQPFNQPTVPGAPVTVSITVPAGSYTVRGGCSAHHLGPVAPSSPPTTFAPASSVLHATPAGSSRAPLTSPVSQATVPDDGSGYATGHLSFRAGEASLSSDYAFTLPRGGLISEQCFGDNATTAANPNQPATVFDEFYLTAVRVKSLHPSR